MSRFIRMAALACMGLMFGLTWAGGAPSVVFLLLGAGGALMAGACAASDL